MPWRCLARPGVTTPISSQPSAFYSHIAFFTQISLTLTSASFIQYTWNIHKKFFGWLYVDMIDKSHLHGNTILRFLPVGKFRCTDGPVVQLQKIIGGQKFLRQRFQQSKSASACWPSIMKCTSESLREISIFQSHLVLFTQTFKESRPVGRDWHFMGIWDWRHNHSFLISHLETLDTASLVPAWPGACSGYCHL